MAKITKNITPTRDVEKDIDSLLTEGVLVELPSDEPELDDYEANENLPTGTTGHYANLVDKIDALTLMDLGQTVLNNVEEDEASRSDWLYTIDMGFDLIGIKLEERSVPFEGACSAQHPLLMESAVKFQSKASNELLPSNGPVKVKIIGEDTEEKEQQALRIQKHMNYQLTEEMSEFYPDSERMLLYVALVGSGFKKTYYSSYLGRPVSEFITADQLIVPNTAPDLFRADRYTHVLYKTQEQLDMDFDSGLYKEPDNWSNTPSDPKFSDVQKKAQEVIGVEVNTSTGANRVYTLYEQHIVTYIDGLDERGSGKYKLASPYVVTVDSSSGKVLSVRRNWKKGDDKLRKKEVMFTHYGLVPGFGFYSLGFLHLLGNLQLSLTSTLRSLVDAGQFANLQGGFKLKGVRILDDGSPVQPGQFKDIESALNDVSKAIMPLPFKGADQTLYLMLEFLDKKGQKFADSTEQVVADSTNYGPVGTTLALLEASTKFFSAIHKRLHASLKQELRLIASINAETLSKEDPYNETNGDAFKVTRKDYSSRVDVTPVSDPNITSSAHRIAKAQTILQIAQSNPEQHNMKEVLRRVYIDMDFMDVDKLLKQRQEPTENDPITDIQLAVSGEAPIKAFKGQDHKSHVAIKQAFLNDPNSGGSPLMQKAALIIQANIQEHLLLGFLSQIEAQGGDPSEAAQQVALMNQQKLQQELEQKKNPDPAGLLAQAEMLDSQTQAKKQAYDERYKAADLELKKEKLDLERIKELRKMEEFDKKLEADRISEVSTKALDAMIQGLAT